LLKQSLPANSRVLKRSRQEMVMQHDSLSPGKESNWLPAPRGPPGVTMRLYEPKMSALDGR
jgi:hypothetical protein